MRKTPSLHGSKPTLLKFPRGFLWGAAASAHQVEGGNHNNWTEWEKLPGKIADGSRSDLACDHYRRYERDFDDLARLGHNTHRLSLEWSRLEPEPGKWNSREFEHYRRVFAALKKRGIEPMVTLHHFTHPLWFERMGAFEHPEAPEIFERFVARAAEELGEGIRLWCTINEPVVYAYFGYLSGIWPPGKTDFGLASLVLRRLLAAHALAYRALHRILGPDVQAGVVMHFRLFAPLRPGNATDRAAAGILDFFLNRAFLIAATRGTLYPPLGVRKRVRRFAGTLDFLGVNYYSRETVRFNPRRGGAPFAEMIARPGVKRNSLGWEIYPEGLYRVLHYCARFGLPLYVTENGTTVADDEVRRDYIASHLEAAHRAIRGGADVRGYYYWSALDNFEWAEGYTARFGLIGVDFRTQKRTIRASGRFLAEVARRNALLWPPSTGKKDTKGTKGREEEKKEGGAKKAMEKRSQEKKIRKQGKENQMVPEEIRKQIIKALYSDDWLDKRLVLKGGNALSLVYRVGNRDSLDLDFSIETDFGNLNGVRQRIENALTYAFKKIGIMVFDLTLNRKPENSADEWWGGYQVEFKLISKEKANILHNNIEKMRKQAIQINDESQRRKYLIEISKFEYVAGKIKRAFDGVSISVYSPLLLAVEKLRALLQQHPSYIQIPRNAKRSRARDLYDIWAISDHFSIKIAEHLSTVPGNHNSPPKRPPG